MKVILKTLKPYWGLVLVIIGLLIVQALCDLALPQYTSNIIDVGITNRGVSHFVPEKITEEEFSYAQLFMTPEEAALWTDAFDPEADGDAVYDRAARTEEELTQLDEALQVPIMMDYQMSRMEESQFRQVVQALLEQTQPAGGAAQVPMENLSIEQLAQLLGVSSLPSFEEEDEDGVRTTYVDLRPLLAAAERFAAADAGTADGSFQAMLGQYRSTVESTIDTMGPSLLSSMGAAFAARCDEAAGMDMNALQMRYMWRVGAWMLLFALLILLCSVAVGAIASGIGASVGRNLRHDIFHNVIGFSNTEINQFSTASLITRSTNDIQQIQMVVVVLLRMVLYAPIMGIGGIYKVLQTRAHMEWIIVLAVAAILLLVTVLMRIALPKFRAMQRLIDAVNMVSREILTGLPVIRAFGREAEEEKRFDAANRELTGTQLFTSRTMVFMMPGMSIIMYGVSLLIVWVAAQRIDAGTLQIGTMTAFITYSMMIVMSFLMLTAISIMLPRAGVAAERIDEVIRTESSVRDPEEAQIESVSAEAERGLVEFDHVSFRYPGASEDVLHDVSFTARLGETTAIIGSTGSGKSTLINLIPRFYDVTEGQIRVDGVDVRHLAMKDLRDRIGFVPQKGVLFSGTIASNLRFGDEAADDAVLRQAAETAQAVEFIDAKEEGFEAPIAQGGTNVSGGQKQRLAIARAIVRRPEIMIFDDSFSALDMKTDAALRKALDETLQESTVLIVAQRISTILHAAQILVLEHGRVVGLGTHEELLASCPVYQEIAASQLSPQELGMEETKKEEV